MPTSEDIKGFYTTHADTIWEKRFNSPDPLRRHAHRVQYETLLSHVPAGESVLDVGCGEGVIPILLAERGTRATGIDISQPNIVAAKKIAEDRGVSSLTTFQEGDAEHVPFADRSFDTVVSSHVLEHLPDFDKGLQELCRVARKRVIVALPTCLNASAAVILGGDYGFWKFSKRSLMALPWGCVRILLNIFGEGVQEGYAGKDELPHIWRYPWVMRRRLRHPDFDQKIYSASTFVLPYIKSSLPFVRWFERFRTAPVLRNFGYGSFMVLERKEELQGLSEQAESGNLNES